MNSKCLFDMLCFDNGSRRRGVDSELVSERNSATVS
jgi:hypothetical protein